MELQLTELSERGFGGIHSPEGKHSTAFDAVDLVSAPCKRNYPSKNLVFLQLSKREANKISDLHSQCKLFDSSLVATIEICNEKQSAA